MAAFSFHWIDLLVVAIVIASAVYATYRGFVSETLSIFAWAAAALATLYFAPSALPLLNGMFSPIVATLAAYIGVFLFVLIPLSFLSYRFAQGVQSSALGTLDRSMGAVFGIIRGLILIAMAYLLFTLIVPVRSQPGWIADAWTLPLVQDTGDVLLSLIPDKESRALTDNEAPATPAQHDDAANPPDLPLPRPKPGTHEASKSHVTKPKKSYGARDRKALDRLIQATGNGD
jgi:membrane protein required for colicin V production